MNIVRIDIKKAEESRQRQARHHAKKLKRRLAKKEAKTKGQPKRITQKRKRSNKAFYSSVNWKRVRYEVLGEQGSTCQICGCSPRDGAVMNVDHIQPLHKRPDLALDKGNLRVLCASCNWGKGEREPLQFEKDFRIPWERFEAF